MTKSHSYGGDFEEIFVCRSCYKPGMTTDELRALALIPATSEDRPDVTHWACPSCGEAVIFMIDSGVIEFGVEPL